MKTYQHYSTSLKLYYSLGLQHQFVSESIRSQIPYSTTVSWRQQDFEQIIGLNLEKTIHQNLTDIQLLYHPKAALPRKLAIAQIRLIILISSFFDTSNLQKVVHRHKTELINFLDRFQHSFSYRTLGRLLRINTKTLYHWRTQIKFKCDHSSLLLCVKRHPNQATIPEVRVVKNWLSKIEYKHWSIHSIWAKALKCGETNLSLKTWYRYNQLLQLRLQTKKGKKPLYEPLLAKTVNEIWHADITVFKTLDGVKHYIYTVMDNYSRFIHSWHVETVVSAKVRLATIQQAIESAFGNNPFEVQLVTDGGPENDNLTIKEFVQRNNINHTIALKDIKQSNSMMEAFYRTSKYQYLYLKQILNGEQLRKEFNQWIEEYNTEKPHSTLGIYTPFEVLKGVDLNLSLRTTFLQAAKQRREINKSLKCSVKCD